MYEKGGWVAVVGFGLFALVRYGRAIPGLDSQWLRLRKDHRIVLVIALNGLASILSGIALGVGWQAILAGAVGASVLSIGSHHGTEVMGKRLDDSTGPVGRFAHRAVTRLPGASILVPIDRSRIPK